MNIAHSSFSFHIKCLLFRLNAENAVVTTPYAMKWLQGFCFYCTCCHLFVVTSCVLFLLKLLYLFATKINNNNFEKSPIAISGRSLFNYYEFNLKVNVWMQYFFVSVFFTDFTRQFEGWVQQILYTPTTLKTWSWLMIGINIIQITRKYTKSASASFEHIILF